MKALDRILNAFKAPAPVPEKRSHYDDRLWFGGAWNDSGPSHRMTPLMAWQIPAVSAAVQVLAGEVATLPLLLYERKENQLPRPAPLHPAAWLLRWDANPIMTARQWRETATVHLCLWGNCYTEVEYDGAGRPRALWLIEPYQVDVLTDGPNREIAYRVNQEGQDSRIVTAENMIHVRWMTPGSGLIGQSPVMRAADSLGLTKAASDFATQFYSKGAHLSGTISFPGELGEVAYQSLKKSWQEAHAGQSGAFTTAILEEGATFNPTSISPEDGQMIPTREFQISEVARIFGIPAHRIGGAGSDSLTYSTEAGERLSFFTTALRPLLTNYEQEINAKLLSRNFYADFDLEEALRPDIKTRYDAHAVALGSGWLTADEVREMEGLPPLPEPEPVPAITAGLEDDGEEGDNLRALAPIIGAGVARILTMQRKAIASGDDARAERMFSSVAVVWSLMLDPIFDAARAMGCDVPAERSADIGATFAELHRSEAGAAEAWSADDITLEILGSLTDGL